LRCLRSYTSIMVTVSSCKTDQSHIELVHEELGLAKFAIWKFKMKKSWINLFEMVFLELSTKENLVLHVFVFLTFKFTKRLSMKVLDNTNVHILNYKHLWTVELVWLTWNEAGKSLIFLFIIWVVAPWAEKMNYILCRDWLPERARRSYRARPGLPALSCPRNVLESHIINPLLAKLVWSRWLDIGLVLFSSSSVWTSTWPISSRLDFILGQ